jgi:hypothetical protein
MSKVHTLLVVCWLGGVCVCVGGGCSHAFASTLTALLALQGVAHTMHQCTLQLYQRESSHASTLKT